MNKMIKEYPIIIQAQDKNSYEEAVEYINKVARHNEFQTEKNKVNYYLEGNVKQKIRTTQSKRTIELTSNVDNEIVNELKGIIKRVNTK